MFTVSGTVIYVSPVETFGAGKQSKRLIVQTQDKYPNYFPVSFYGDKINTLDNVKNGDFVEIETFPSGRLKKGDDTSAFVFLNGWSCNVVPTGSTASQPSQPANQPAPAPQKTQTSFNLDDIPF